MAPRSYSNFQFFKAPQCGVYSLATNMVCQQLVDHFKTLDSCFFVVLRQERVPEICISIECTVDLWRSQHYIASLPFNRFFNKLSSSSWLTKWSSQTFANFFVFLAKQIAYFSEFCHTSIDWHPFLDHALHVKLYRLLSPPPKGNPPEKPINDHKRSGLFSDGVSLAIRLIEPNKLNQTIYHFYRTLYQWFHSDPILPFSS